MLKIFFPFSCFFAIYAGNHSYVWMVEVEKFIKAIHVHIVKTL